MNAFTIKDLENLSGIKAHTIRIWEKRYGILKPSRSGTNIRFYSNDELKALLNISYLNKYGFKISRIAKMDSDELRESMVSIGIASAAEERVILELLKLTIDTDSLAFESLLDRLLRNKGMPYLVEHIIFPYLEKVGMLWITDRISPAQEHVVSCILRQKLLTAIEGIKRTYEEEEYTALLFLPEGEYHELSLIFVNYMMRSQGIATIYLGCSIPMRFVDEIVTSKKPHLIYTHITTAGKNFVREKFFDTLYRVAGKIPVSISGAVIKGYDKKLPSTFTLHHSLSSVRNLISTLPA